MTEEERIAELKKEAGLVAAGLAALEEKRNAYKSRLDYLDSQLKKNGDAYE